MLLALYQPDIPQNVGSLIRLGAGMGIPLHIIEPCGFPFDDKRMRRVAMDYYDLAEITRHPSWRQFHNFKKQQNGRLVLLTTKATLRHVDFIFTANDILLFGRESSGVPAEVHETAEERITIPMKEGARSLNLAQAASMVLGEALRQTKGFG